MTRLRFVLLLALAAPAPAAEPPAKNVILFLGDAGGLPTLNAASIHGYSEPRRLFLQSMLFRDSEKNAPTDDIDSIRFENRRRDDDHTGEEALVAAQGPGSQRVRGILENTDLFHIMLAAYGWQEGGKTHQPEAEAKVQVVEVSPAGATEAVGDDPDDPAIWVHPTDPRRSLILATDKTGAPAGSVFAFGLDGKTRQRISGLDRPNNIDVEYGLRLGGQSVDIAVVTERYKRRLRVFRIAADGSGISDISSLEQLQVFAGAAGDAGAPMGVALYRRPRDGVIFAIVSPKSGPREGYLAQYRLDDNGKGQVRATPVRRFGRFSGTGEIEAIAVDDALGYVYYADEGGGIHKYHADPDHPDAVRELAQFGQTGFLGDREGIAIYARGDGTGYIVCTDQLDDNSQYRVYSREGAPGRPHDHSAVLKVIRSSADSTDGLEITSASLGEQFPHGVMIAMNSGPRNFLIFRWDDIARTGTPKLQMGPSAGPRPAASQAAPAAGF